MELYCVNNNFPFCPSHALGINFNNYIFINRNKMGFVKFAGEDCIKQMFRSYRWESIQSSKCIIAREVKFNLFTA